MTNKQKTLFLDILNIQSYTYETETMANFIVNTARVLGADVYVEDGNVYVTKGKATSYPCIASHTDTVHRILKDGYKVIHDTKIAMAYNEVANKPTGIGGDDKVGIFIALDMLIRLESCKAVFFRDEETGCEGSMVADMDFFMDCRFVLQCDRKGNGDFVNNIMGQPLYGAEFSKAISPILKKHKYKECSGGLTDVYQLCENGVGVAVANMSCGYHNPHSDSEMINFADVENCMSLVYDIMTSCKKVYKYEAEYTTKWWDSYDTKKTTYAPTKDDWDNSYSYEYKKPKYYQDLEYKELIKLYDQCWDCRQFIEKGDMADFGLCKECSKTHSIY